MIRQSKNTFNISNSAGATVDNADGHDSFEGKAEATVTPADTPNLGLNAPPVQSRVYPYQCNTQNVNYGVRLDLTSTVPQISAKNTGTTQDEMSLRQIFSTYSYAGQFTVNTSNVLGQTVFTGDICPCSEFFYAGDGTDLVPSLFSYFALPFSFWRGSIKIKIVVMASPGHTGRLQIRSHVGYEAGDLTLAEATGQEMCVINLEGYSEIEVVFPWASDTPWKKVCNGSYSNGNPYSMGQWSVGIMSALQAPETVSQAIDCVVFIAGGEDFECEHLATNGADTFPLPL